MRRDPSRPADAAATLALAVLGYRATTLVINAVALPRLRPAPVRQDAPRVSILVPARNEAATLPRTLPGLLAQGAQEVILLDDGSTDGTGEIARDLGARVIEGATLPAGWAGKPWACHQLAQAAGGDLLVFTDADVHWRPGALGAVLAAWDASAGRTPRLLSVWPRQLTPRVGLRLLTPLVDAAMLGNLPVPLMDTPLPGAAAANGQVMMFDRAGYAAIGGHESVRASVLEDVELARTVRRAGGRVTLALGDDAIEVQMYPDAAASIAGLAKSTPGLHGGSRPAMLASWALFTAAFTLPWLLPTSPRVRLARALTVLDRAAVNLLVGRRSPADLAEGLLGPATPLLALPVYRRALRRTITWRGRTYPR
ncbi:glycosyltransferase [Serinibacter salmoneus]|uniref:Glycosyl transferase family 2 n=1 Tax=Serinibacter salmoneus TaxID=556530 RepID=A0A2A9CZN0_9MICO|nr:glycosyltransferase family 2 protein [Serinibacter salmoneus]PFG19908.1 glycosyl transferase family 2 [Serinibacter salmoneus]